MRYTAVLLLLLLAGCREVVDLGPTVDAAPDDAGFPWSDARPPDAGVDASSFPDAAP